MARLVVNQTNSIDVPNAGQAWGPFNQAITQIENRGGIIEVLPGDYVVNDAGPAPGNGIYVAGRNNVTIRLHPGATIRPGSGITNLITVTGSRFTLEGHGTLKAASSTTTLLNVSYVAAAGADSGDFVRVLGPRFDCTENANASLRAVRLVGQNYAATQKMRHVNITGCHFYLPTSTAGTGSSIIRTRNVDSAVIQNNLFGSRDVENTVTYANRLINCYDASFTSIAGNVVHYVQGVGSTSSIIYLETNPTTPQEAGHGNVGPNNRTENQSWDHLVYIGGVDFMTIHGNNWGRHSNLASRIRATYKSDGTTKGRALAIFDEAMHVADGTGTRYGVHIEGFDGVDLSGLQYYNMHNAGTLVRVEDTATNITVDASSMSVVPSTPGDPYTLVDWEDYTASSSGYRALDNSDDGATIPVSVRDLRLDGTSGSFGVTLAPAASVPGATVVVKRTDSASGNTVTLNGAGSDTVDGAASKTIPISTTAVLVSAGDDWLDTLGVL